ncbi:Enoyl-CoA hydratase/isomerase [Methylobacterium sp. 4-46]|uniref:enoyl-CoA hydratase-related protein n=1 Tax=unclassified Methylobacterium TaxID=2615210 RepID=UPI000152C8D2|nr:MULTISPECIES: enoyl-CoA hydratase-related protein [Methylobacterium]ACA16829.1 Enoyl-CoA hydratase/isomerase [Methylobacterium sp. 4-46]WFT82523.1 enoyl-CoA hydratase-related protein [Methylobacterium nodulans]
MTELVRITREAGGVCLIRLARPEKKNALTGAMYDAMREALIAADADGSGTGAIVFAGGEGAFSAGNDIADFVARAGAAFGDAPSLRFIRQLSVTRTPMVAAVDGLAIGIGTTLTLHCDLVYVSPRAQFRTPFVDLGLVPEAASSYLLPRRVGLAKASEILMLAEPFGGEEALRLGLANALLPSDALLDHALAQAAKLAAKPRGALAATRALIRGDHAAVAAALDAEVAAFDAALRSPEAQAAFRAFLDKSKSRG